MAGFIHNKLDMKLLTLYILTHAAAPIDFATLTDLAMCDGGVDYFQFAEAASELVASGHIIQNGDLYAPTEKGRRDCDAGESSLSPVVRARCDRRLAPLNEALKRRAQVRASLEPAGDGWQVALSMDDDRGPLLSLTLLASSKEEGQRIADRFLARPDRVYNGVLGVLLPDEEDGIATMKTEQDI